MRSRSRRAGTAGSERAAGERRRGVARDEAQNHPANKALLPTGEYAGGKAWAFCHEMKATDIILQTERFRVVWGDDGDASPPPGYELSSALLGRLIAAGATSKAAELPRDYWEHSNWYFFVDWRSTHYSIIVEPSFEDTGPPTWHIGVSKPLGLLKGLWGRDELRYDVDDSFLQLVEACVKEVAGLNTVEWMTADCAAERMFPAEVKPRNWHSASQRMLPNDAGWVQCPGCGERFKPAKSALYRDGRHVCGQRIEIPAEQEHASDG